MTQTDSADQQTMVASQPLHIEEQIIVGVPVHRAYEVWRDFTRFPEFMSNVEEVRPIGGNRYHWVARIFGIRQEWDAEVTDTTPNRRVAWQSVNGAPNSGTVTFDEREPGVTDLWVTMEYTPPAGVVGKALDKLTKTTQREVKEDLRNFKRSMTGETSGSSEGLLQPKQGSTEIGAILASLAGPAAGAAIGGVTAYFLQREVAESLSWNRPASWVRVPLAQATRMSVGAFQSPIATPQPVSGPASILSWTMASMAAASVATAAALRATNRRRDALFVGEWAPTFLGWSLLARLMGHRGTRHDLGASVTSWSLLGASLGSVVSSAIQHLRGKRKDGLFVGQWAPTFMIVASLVRLVNR